MSHYLLPEKKNTELIIPNTLLNYPLDCNSPAFNLSTCVSKSNWSQNKGLLCSLADSWILSLPLFEIHQRQKHLLSWMKLITNSWRRNLIRQLSIKFFHFSSIQSNKVCSHFFNIKFFLYYFSFKQFLKI